MQKEMLINYINICSINKPIFVSDIKDNFKVNDCNKLYVYINRLVKSGDINVFSNGVYYKGMITAYQVIEKKYIKDDNEIKGYLTGDSLLYELGIIKNKPEYVDLISNVCYKGSRYKNNTLGVIVHRPRITVNNENYRYLQLFDLIKLDVDGEVVYKFIDNNNLNWDKIFMYAKKCRYKSLLDKFYK